MLTRRHNHPAPRACLNIDVRVYAALTDEFEFVEAFQKRSPDRCPFPNQHQDFGVAQPLSQSVRFLHMIVPDFHFMTRQFLETGQRAQRIEVVVKNRDFHLQALFTYKPGSRRERPVPAG